MHESLYAPVKIHESNTHHHSLTWLSAVLFVPFSSNAHTTSKTQASFFSLNQNPLSWTIFSCVLLWGHSLFLMTFVKSTLQRILKTLTSLDCVSQLSLEKHGFELCRSTYTRNFQRHWPFLFLGFASADSTHCRLKTVPSHPQQQFPHCIKNIVLASVVGGIHRFHGPTVVKFWGSQRLYADFQLCRGQRP